METGTLHSLTFWLTPTYVRLRPRVEPLLVSQLRPFYLFPDTVTSSLFVHHYLKVVPGLYDHW